MSVNTPSLSSPLHAPTFSPSSRLLIPQNGLPFSLNSQFRPSPSFPSLSLISSFYKQPKPRSLTTVAAAALGNLSQTEAISVPSDLQQALGAFPSEAGVYAVFDGDGDLQFIGISRNIAASIVGHRKSLLELCCSVKGMQYNQEYEASQNDNLQPLHRSDLQSRMQSGYSLHTRNPAGITKYFNSCPDAHHLKV